MSSTPHESEAPPPDATPPEDEPRFDAPSEPMVERSGVPTTEPTGAPTVAQPTGVAGPPPVDVFTEPGERSHESAPASTVSTEERLREAERRRARDRVAGLVVVVVAFAGTLAISYWARVTSEPLVAPPPGPPETTGIPGFPARVDPVATLARARELTMREELRGFVAQGVSPDGSVDLGKDDHYVRYTFQSKKGEGPEQPRPRGVLAQRRYCGMQRINVKRIGIYAEPDRPSYPCRDDDVVGLPAPACSMSALWQRAVELGAPKRGEVARIEYYATKDGEPAYRFTIDGSRHRYELAADCRRRLSRKDGRGVVP